MRLTKVTIQSFRNFTSPQTISVEDDVTNLVGKNESGKTTILNALHRLKPANGTDQKFDLTTEYPRWRLAPDRRADPELAKNVRPVAAEFSASDADLERLEAIIGVRPPAEIVLHAAKNYLNTYFVWLTATPGSLIQDAAEECNIVGADLEELLDQGDVDAAITFSRQQAKDMKEPDPLRAKAYGAFPSMASKLQEALKLSDPETRTAVGQLVPRFFYFSNYNLLPGECDLTDLAENLANGRAVSDSHRSVVALLAHAGEKPEDFMDADYNSRKAELQAASSDLSRHVFEYWRQNTDLDVVFDTDNVVVENVAGNDVAHRILKIELRDGRHGGVETNFATRSAGFQWFFSFFAAFSEYQSSKEDIIVLLDEPGTSLHGDAQRDFVRFVFRELGASKQTIYTTHSQHMIDPTQYEKLRAVHDRATRDEPELGVEVTPVNLSADRGTLLPIESALGYSVSQHLFIGSGHHLAVEGSSDYVYLQRFTEHELRQGREGLDPRFAVIPVGGADNMPAFVALLGRRLRISALVDGARASTRLARIQAAARDNHVPEANIVSIAQVAGMAVNADVEDLFAVEDYIRLYNWTFDKSITAGDLAPTGEPILKRIEDRFGSFDHALPAHTLTRRRTDFFAAISAKTVTNFGQLFQVLNATLETETERSVEGP